MLKRCSEEDIAFFSVALFAGAWLCIGNFWSLVSTYTFVSISTATTILSVIIYLAVALPVVIFFFVELLGLKSRLKWIILAEVLTFMIFVIPPPRNADAMRVWLAKVYDVFMQGRKLVRPYWHYNTPDAFTLFHLPMINMWDGQIFQLSIWIALCGVIILLIKIGRIYLNDRAIAIALCLFVFNPLIILASTVVITDIPIILAVAGLVYAMILYEKGRFKGSLFLVALFTAFGMNIKYNMLMFLPAVLYWSVKKTWKDGVCWKLSPLVLFFMGVAILPYWTNYLNIGNPVWPALIKYFPSKNPYWDEVALNAAGPFLAGDRNLWSFVRSFGGLFIIPQHVNPLAMCTVFFVIRRDKYLNFMPGLMAVSYLFIVWLMMPKFSVDEKERYVLYLLPIIIPFGLAKIYETISKHDGWKKFGRAMEFFVVASVLVYAAFTLVYSKDAFKYISTGDKALWHRATWYYEDYDWINKNIDINKPDQILVISAHQQTYYLKKPYVNGDDLSALINWRSLTGLKEIIVELNKNNIKYIYTDADYIKKNEHISRVLGILLEEHVLTVVRRNNIKLVFSRLKGTYLETNTVLYKVKTSASSGGD